MFTPILIFSKYFRGFQTTKFTWTELVKYVTFFAVVHFYKAVQNMYSNFSNALRKVRIFCSLQTNAATKAAFLLTFSVPCRCLRL